MRREITTSGVIQDRLTVSKQCTCSRSSYGGRLQDAWEKGEYYGSYIQSGIFQQQQKCRIVQGELPLDPFGQHPACMAGRQRDFGKQQDISGSKKRSGAWIEYYKPPLGKDVQNYLGVFLVKEFLFQTLHFIHQILFITHIFCLNFVVFTLKIL